jgi:ABC-type polysaccharide/polyol phosphate export permease
MYDTPFIPPSPPPPPAAQKHSTLGIVSLVLAILAMLIMCVDVVIIMGITGGTNISTEVGYLDAALSCLAAIMALTGLGLGIAAVSRKDAKKLFGILGLVLNGLYLIGYCGLVGINMLSLF